MNSITRHHTKVVQDFVSVFTDNLNLLEPIQTLAVSPDYWMNTKLHLCLPIRHLFVLLPRIGH